MTSPVEARAAARATNAASQMAAPGICQVRNSRIELAELRTVHHILGTAQTHERHFLALRFAGRGQQDTRGCWAASRLSCTPGQMQLAALPAPHTRLNWNEAINTRRLAHSSVKRVLPRRQNFTVPSHVSPIWPSR